VCPDAFTVKLVGANQNAYVFSGNRGRIYITNGSAIELYKKVPDYVTGTLNPYIRWWDASYNRNQLYFNFSATSNADADLTTTNGAWAIDLNLDAMRMVNKITNSGYAGFAPMVVEMPPFSQTDNPQGSSLTIGWTVSTTYGVDVGGTAPYTTFEAYADTDIIPVGTFIDSFTPSQVEWKASAPIVAGEGVRLYYRTNLTDSFTLIGESTTAGALSDMFQTNFQKAQWVQFRIETRSTASTPSFVRITEIRVREFPN